MDSIVHETPPPPRLLLPDRSSTCLPAAQLAHPPRGGGTRKRTPRKLGGAPAASPGAAVFSACQIRLVILVRDLRVLLAVAALPVPSTDPRRQGAQRQLSLRSTSRLVYSYCLLLLHWSCMYDYRYMYDGRCPHQRRPGGMAFCLSGRGTNSMVIIGLSHVSPLETPLHTISDIGDLTLIVQPACGASKRSRGCLLNPKP